MAQSGLSLPYPYFVGDYAPDTFEDVTSKNVTFLASKMGGATRMRFLYGVVNGTSGASVGGSAGWTSSRTSTGTYQIVFDSQFPAAPVAVCTAVTGVCNALATTSQLDVTTFSIGGSSSDQSFQFLVLF